MFYTFIDLFWKINSLKYIIFCLLQVEKVQICMDFMWTKMSLKPLIVQLGILTTVGKSQYVLIFVIWQSFYCMIIDYNFQTTRYIRVRFWSICCLRVIRVLIYASHTKMAKKDFYFHKDSLYRYTTLVIPYTCICNLRCREHDTICLTML